MPTLNSKSLNNFPKGDSRNRYDWKEIREKYLFGVTFINPETGETEHVYPTLDDLQQEYGMNIYTIKIKSSKEEWSKHRDLFKTKRKQKGMKDGFNYLYSESAYVDAVTLSHIRCYLKIIGAFLKKYPFLSIDEQGVLTFDDDYDFEEEGSFPLSPRELKDMVDVSMKVQQLIRKTTGEADSTRVTNQELENLVRKEVEIDTPANRASVDKLIEKRKASKKLREDIDAEIAELQKEIVS